MKYEYVTATGKHEIEVNEQFYDLLLAMDREEYNSDRKHNRRKPVSLEGADYEGDWFADGSDLLAVLIESETINEALSCLSERQQYLITKCCLEGCSYVYLAAQESLTEGAIRHAVERAKRRLKNSIS